MRASKPAEQSRPQLRLRSRFHFVMELWRHPVRLAACLLLILFLMPEYATIARWIGFAPVAVPGLIVLAVVIAGVLPPMIMSAANCRYVVYDFFDDHLCFTESAILRDKIRVQYKSVSAVTLRQTPLQRKLKLADIVIDVRPAGLQDMRGTSYVIADIRAARRKAEKIQSLISVWRDAHGGSSAAGAPADTGSDRR